MLGVCSSCGFDLSSRVAGFDGVTDAGPLGPLQDFVLREERGSVPGPHLRQPSRSRATKAKSPATPLLGFHEEPSSDRADKAAGAGGSHTGSLPPRRGIGSYRAGVDANESADPRRRRSTGSPADADNPVKVLKWRVLAGVLDGVILVGINLAIVYLTLRLAELPLAAAAQLPRLPLLAFLFLFDLGYLVVLTACGGQTIGKMATGLRVERLGGDPITWLESVLRAAAYAVSVLPAGLGFIGVWSRRQRSWHDQLADTRVVKFS